MKLGHIVKYYNVIFKFDNGTYPGLQIRGVKGISAQILLNSTLKIKLQGKNTLCSLRFQC